jgi:hypothetical protein
MLTWQAQDGHGFEGTRLLLGAKGAFRALGRLIRVEPEGDFTASYRLVVAEGGVVERLSVTSATAARERHLTLNRTEDGYWLLDTGSGGARTDFDGALDINLDHSPLFNTLAIRRLGLHREPGEHTLPTVHVSLPGLEVRVVEQHYRTVSVAEDGTAVIAFRRDDTETEILVDSDGLVIAFPGVGDRLSASGVAPAAG